MITWMMGDRLSEPNSVVAQLPTCPSPVNRNNDIEEEGNNQFNDVDDKVFIHPVFNPIPAFPNCDKMSRNGALIMNSV